MTLGISCACGAPNPTNDTYQPNWCNFLTMASATQTQTGNKERVEHPELRNMQMIKLISRPPSNHWNLTTPERWTLIIDPATVIVYDRRSSDLEHHLFTVASPLSKYRSICGRSKYRSWRFKGNFYSRRTLSTTNNWSKICDASIQSQCGTTKMNNNMGITYTFTYLIEEWLLLSSMDN